VTLLLETGFEFVETAQFTASGSLRATGSHSSLGGLAATQGMSLGLILGTVAAVIFVAVIIGLVVIVVRRSAGARQPTDTESSATDMEATIETLAINPVVTETDCPETNTTLVFGTYAPADPYQAPEFGFKIPTLPTGFNLWDHDSDECR
jgi:hypothetical protein